jgi:hypothetical protein
MDFLNKIGEYVQQNMKDKWGDDPMHNPDAWAEGGMPLGPGGLGSMVNRFAGVRGFMGKEALNPQSQHIQRMAGEWAGIPAEQMSKQMAEVMKKAELSKLLQFLQGFGR